MYDPTSPNADDQHYAYEYEQQQIEWERQIELQEALEQDEASEQDEEAGILTEAEAEELIREYIRSDRSAKYIEDVLPY